MKNTTPQPAFDSAATIADRKDLDARGQRALPHCKPTLMQPLPMAMVVESYALFFGALLVEDHCGSYGRRRVTQGIVLFAAASACCGLASNVNSLILVGPQGIGGALGSGRLAIISTSFSEEDRGGASVQGPSARSPPSGRSSGWLSNTSVARCIFYQPPIAALVLVCCTGCPERRNEHGQSTGLLGAWPLATTGLGLLVSV